jgi:hypothetical protein
MQISGYPAALHIYNMIERSSASPAAIAPGIPPNGAGAKTTGAPLSSASNGTPLQFSVSMLLDLLNAQGQNLQSDGPQIGPDGKYGIQTFSSCSVSNGGLPGGLPLNGLNATTAASEVIGAVGSDGELNLSDVDRALGITTPEKGYQSLEAITALEWTKLTGASGGALTTTQLTMAIQNYLDTQSTAPPQSKTALSALGIGHFEAD